MTGWSRAPTVAQRDTGILRDTRRALALGRFMQLSSSIAPIAAGLAEGWAVLADQMPSSHRRRDEARGLAIVTLVDALEVGLPGGMLSTSDYFAPLEDEPAVQAALQRQAEASEGSSEPLSR